jgi:hypothetical protein
MQQCDDLSYTQQLQRQEFETDRMRAQDRATQVSYHRLPSSLPSLTRCRVPQEMKDHEVAMKLAAELEQAQVAANAPAMNRK